VKSLFKRSDDNAQDLTGQVEEMRLYVAAWLRQRRRQLVQPGGAAPSPVPAASDLRGPERARAGGDGGAVDDIFGDL